MYYIYTVLICGHVSAPVLIALCPKLDLMVTILYHIKLYIKVTVLYFKVAVFSMHK